MCECKSCNACAHESAHINASVGWAHPGALASASAYKSVRAYRGTHDAMNATQLACAQMNAGAWPRAFLSMCVPNLRANLRGLMAGRMAPRTPTRSQQRNANRLRQPEFQPATSMAWTASRCVRGMAAWARRCDSYFTVTSQLLHSYFTVTSQLLHENHCIILASAPKGQNINAQTLPFLPRHHKSHS